MAAAPIAPKARNVWPIRKDLLLQLGLEASTEPAPDIVAFASGLDIRKGYRLADRGPVQIGISTGGA
jgi:hypothetical protein